MGIGPNEMMMELNGPGIPNEVVMNGPDGPKYRRCNDEWMNYEQREHKLAQVDPREGWMKGGDLSSIQKKWAPGFQHSKTLDIRW